MSGLFMRFTENFSAVKWEGATFDITVSPDPAETWTFSTDFGVKAASAWDVVKSIETWANAGGRAWTGVVTFTASHNNLAGLAPYVGVQFTATATATYAPSSEIQTLLGFASSTTGTVVRSGGDACFGSCSALVGVRHHSKTNMLRGFISDNGSGMGGSHVTGLERPGLSVVCDPAEATALGLAFKFAGNPRAGHFYDEAAGAFRLLSIGKMPKARTKGPNLYRYAFKALGGTVY